MADQIELNLHQCLDTHQARMTRMGSGYDLVPKQKASEMCIIPKFEIRPIAATDYDAWRSLWGMYCSFYQVSLDERVTDCTWRRLNDPAVPIYGLVACKTNGEILGFCHYVCHPNTWSDQTVCYLEDVFVAPSGRRLGVATAFIEKLKAIGAEENWTRVYWITNEENVVAQATYDKVAKRSGHIRYEVSFDSK